MEPADIPQRLLKLMKEKNVSKYRVAKDSGLNDSTFYGVFDENSVASLNTLYCICKNGLGITLEEFFHDDDPGKENLEIRHYDLEVIHISHQLNEQERQRLIAYGEGLIAQHQKE